MQNDARTCRVPLPEVRAHHLPPETALSCVYYQMPYIAHQWAFTGSQRLLTHSLELGTHHRPPQTGASPGMLHNLVCLPTLFCSLGGRLR